MLYGCSDAVGTGAVKEGLIRKEHHVGILNNNPRHQLGSSSVKGPA